MPVREWDGTSYDRISGTMEALGREVLERLQLDGDELVLDAGCGSGRITAALIERLPRGRVIAVDGSESMAAAARRRLGPQADVRVGDLLELELGEPVDAILSTAALHWVPDHDRLWRRLAQALRPGGMLEVQCGGVGNIDGVRQVIDAVARDAAPELVGWSPWVFAGPQETGERLRDAGLIAIRCWLERRPTYPRDVAAFVSTSILAAHLARLPEDSRERFAAAVVAGVRLPLDYVRLNVSAVRGPA